MANGYIVGTILDLVPGYPSTTAKVQIFLGTVLKRTLYLTKAAQDQDWNYSTAIAPTVSPNTYTVKAFNTVPNPDFAYQDALNVVVADAQPTPVNFVSKGSPGALVDDRPHDAYRELEAERARIEKHHQNQNKISRLTMTIVEVDEPDSAAASV